MVAIIQQAVELVANHMVIVIQQAVELFANHIVAVIPQAMELAARIHKAIKLVLSNPFITALVVGSPFTATLVVDNPLAASIPFPQVTRTVGNIKVVSKLQVIKMQQQLIASSIKVIKLHTLQEQYRS